MHIILGLGVLGLVAGMVVMWLSRMAPESRRELSVKGLWIGIALLVVFLTLTGRLPWLVTVILGFAAVLQRLLVVWRGYRASDEATRPKPPPDTPPMDRAEAFEVLGLKPNASREQIIEAHRRLIQKYHPDRGGSDYLASRINHAKSLLFDEMDA